MTYKVTVSSGNVYNAKVSEPQKIKANFAYKVEFMPQRLDDLLDVQIEEVDGQKNKYVLMYNQTSQTWQSVNPDEVLSAAATELIQPNLPDDFVEQVADQVHIDGGSFTDF